MSTQHSNQKQRRAALLRASVLVVLLMALSGFTVSLFPKAVLYNQAESADKCAIDQQKLAVLTQQNKLLLSKLIQMDSQYTIITSFDNEWEAATGAGIGAALKDKIQPHEDDLRKAAIDLSKSDTFELAIQASSAYKNLMIARDMIWKMRGQSYASTVPPSDAAQMEMVLLRRDAKTIADELDSQADFIDEEIKVGGFFWKSGKKETRRELVKVVKNLHTLADRLRRI